jgi:hypothetical protein
MTIIHVVQTDKEVKYTHLGTGCVKLMANYKRVLTTTSIRNTVSFVNNYHYVDNVYFDKRLLSGYMHLSLCHYG